MKSALAKARDKWLFSNDGRECCKGQTSGQYLHNRLERAFLAGANFSSERIKELEEQLTKARGLLREALPHIECNSYSHSGLITAIGEYLEGEQTLKG